jgi:hypothetical protein
MPPCFEAFTSLLASFGGHKSRNWASSFHSRNPVDLSSIAPSTQPQEGFWDDSSSIRSYNPRKSASTTHGSVFDLFKGKRSRKRRGYPALPLTITLADGDHVDSSSKQDVQGPLSAYSSVRETASPASPTRTATPPYSNRDVIPNFSRLYPYRKVTRKADSTFSGVSGSPISTLATEYQTPPHPAGDMLSDPSRHIDHTSSGDLALHQPRPVHPLPQFVGGHVGHLDHMSHNAQIRRLWRCWKGGVSKILLQTRGAIYDLGRPWLRPKRAFRESNLRKLERLAVRLSYQTRPSLMNLLALRLGLRNPAFPLDLITSLSTP